MSVYDITFNIYDGFLWIWNIGCTLYTYKYILESSLLKLIDIANEYITLHQQYISLANIYGIHNCISKTNVMNMDDTIMTYKKIYTINTAVCFKYTTEQL